MNPRAWVALLACIAVGIGSFGIARVRAVRRTRVETAITAEPEAHKVTPGMRIRAADRDRTPAPPFRQADASGVTRDLGDLLKSGPVVLVFIKDGCPCSVSAAPYFNRLHQLYGGRVQVLGVIDGDAEVARRWGASNRVPFPILTDPELRIAANYDATNSAFVALIDADGQIDELWPGYSASMLGELNGRVAAMAGVPQQPLDTSDAPEELYSGCPFPGPNDPS